MRPLIIGPAERQAIDHLVALARANPLMRDYLTLMARGFDPLDPRTRNPAGEVIPAHFTIDLPVDVRVTYTEEEQPLGMCRHLSTSIADGDGVPGPAIVDELLRLFGFAGRLGGPSLHVWPERYRSGRIAVNIVEKRESCA